MSDTLFMQMEYGFLSCFYPTVLGSESFRKNECYSNSYSNNLKMKTSFLQ